MSDAKTAPIDWAAYCFRDGFTLFEVACLLHRLDPRAVYDDAHHAIRKRGGVAAEVLKNPADGAEMLYLNPAAYFMPPVGDTLERLKRAAGSRLGLAVGAGRARALAAMLDLPFPPELKREAPAPAADPVPAVAPKTHRTKRRAAPLAAVLNEAKRQALDSTDWHSVWAALAELAKSASRPAPLLGYVEGEGVQYQTDSEAQPVGYLTRDAFRKRFPRIG